MKKILIILILLFVNTFAQEINYTIDQLKVADGLSQTTIQAILQDKKGYMWFGTGNGLNRFDGYNFVVYRNNPLDDNSISNNAITSLYEDDNGFIWIGTISGIVNRFDRNSNTFLRLDISATLPLPENPTEYYEYPISFSRNNNNSITSITEDNDGNLWIGTWGKGLVVLNKKTGKKTHFTYNRSNPEGLSYNRIMKIIKDKDGTMWIATFGGGLNRAQKNNKGYVFDKYLESERPGAISDNRILSLMEDKNEGLWIGTFSGGLNYLSKENEELPVNSAKFITYKNSFDINSLSNDIVMSIIEDRFGYIWIGTFGGGLDRFNRKNNEFINFKNLPLEDNSIADNEVISLYEDKGGIIWVGTHLGSGISKLLGNRIKFNKLKRMPDKPNSLSDDVVWSVYKDKEGILWIGTYRGGLNKYDPVSKKVTVYNTKNSGIAGDHIRAITEDKSGNLWIGTYNKGLNRFNKKTGKFTLFTHSPNNPNSLSANPIQSIYIDSRNTIWIGTFGGGLNYADLNKQELKFSAYKNDPNNFSSISDNRVYSIFEDSRGVLWIGTFGGGLNKFNSSSKTFERFQNRALDGKSLSSDRVMCVFEDSKNQLWIGTYGGGLNKFNQETRSFKRYYGNEKISSDVVYGILEDDNNNIWMSSDNGLFRLNLNTEGITNYQLDDGIQDLEFSGGAYYRTSDGELIFGGVKGLNYFYPKNIQDNKFIPQIVINSIKVFDKELQGERKEIELEYYENFLTFEFAALDFANPKNNTYKYMLEGLENDWITTSSSMRIASYTNLAPGEYIFKVKGSNSDATWNNTGAEVRIVIKSPIWKRWWFITGGVILLGIILYYLSTVRIKTQLAIERLKAKLAADLHDNIGSGLTEISILSEVAKNAVPEENIQAQNNLKNISEEARVLVDNMSDIVWVVNPKRDSLHDLIIRLKDSYGDLLQQLGISFKIVGLEKISNIKLPMDYKQNLFLIFKESINNCIKHSNCTRIVLDVHYENSLLEITLSDDGKGLPDKYTGLGNGLKNMQTRAAICGGTLQIDSESEKWTRIKFRGKISKLSKLKLYFYNKV